MTRLEYGHISVQNHGRLCNVRLNRDTDNIRSICIATLNGMKLASLGGSRIGFTGTLSTNHTCSRNAHANIEMYPHGALHPPAHETPPATSTTTTTFNV